MILVGTAGCNLVAPQATTYPYFASDGVSADLGDIDVRNALVITDKGVLGNLVVTIVNNSNEDAEIRVQYESDGATKNAELEAPANATTVFGEPEGEQLILRGIDTQPGALLPIYFQSGEAEGKELLVPVLNGGLPEYSHLLPVDVLRK